MVKALDRRPTARSPYRRLYDRAPRADEPGIHGRSGARISFGRRKLHSGAADLRYEAASHDGSRSLAVKPQEVIPGQTESDPKVLPRWGSSDERCACSAIDRWPQRTSAARRHHAQSNTTCLSANRDPPRVTVSRNQVLAVERPLRILGLRSRGPTAV